MSTGRGIGNNQQPVNNGGRAKVRRIERARAECDATLEAMLALSLARPELTRNAEGRIIDSATGRYTEAK